MARKTRSKEPDLGPIPPSDRAPDLLPTALRATWQNSVYSGDPATDCYLGRIAFGSTVHLVASPKAGKTLISLLYLNQLLYHPRNRDRVVLLLDLEGAISPQFLTRLWGPNARRAILLSGIRATAQNVGYILTSTRFKLDELGCARPAADGPFPGLASGQVAGVLLDSLDFLQSEQDYEKYLTEGIESSHNLGATASALAVLFRLIRPLLVRHDAILFYTNHRLKQVNLANPNIRVDRIFGGIRMTHAATVELYGELIGGPLRVRPTGTRTEPALDELEQYYRAQLRPMLPDPGSTDSSVSTDILAGYRASWRVTRNKTCFGLGTDQSWSVWIEIVHGPRFQLAFSYLTGLVRLAQLGYLYYPVVSYGSGSVLVLPYQLDVPLAQPDLPGIKLSMPHPDRPFGEPGQPHLLVAGTQQNALKMIRLDSFLEANPDYRAWLAQWYYRKLAEAQAREEARQVLANLTDLTHWSSPIGPMLLSEPAPESGPTGPTELAGPTDPAPSVLNEPNHVPDSTSDPGPGPGVETRPEPGPSESDLAPVPGSDPDPSGPAAGSGPGPAPGPIGPDPGGPAGPGPVAYEPGSAPAECGPTALGPGSGAGADGIEMDLQGPLGAEPGTEPELLGPAVEPGSEPGPDPDSSPETFEAGLLGLLAEGLVSQVE